MAWLACVSLEAVAQSRAVITESTIGALVILSVATTTLMMGWINLNFDLWFQITAGVSRLHVCTVVVVIFDLQLRLQSGVRRVSETNRTRKFSRNLTGEARRDIWDDEVWQLCESGQWNLS